ncbi:MAG: chemotaxis protein CheW [Pseudohongiella sp.]|nr:chemotaxis protein CheW [Pseudohongiella sp.]MDP2126591.1 chemotaxis protein CheW [Pseudohongiella sp.]
MNTQGNLAMAHDASAVAEPLDMIKHVSFELGDETYAINAARVNEVLRYTEITPVPGSAYFILGIINLRGNVVTVIDARTVFGLPTLDHTHNSRIIVVEIEDFVLGILVDRVAEVIDLNKHAIEIAPATSQDASSRFIQGVYNENNHLMILVDFSRVTELLPH